MAMTYVLMADLFTLEERAKFVSLLTLVYLVGTSAGPLLGGGLASHASWVCCYICYRFRLWSLTMRIEVDLLDSSTPDSYRSGGRANLHQSSKVTFQQDTNFEADRLGGNDWFCHWNYSAFGGSIYRKFIGVSNSVNFN